MDLKSLFSKSESLSVEELYQIVDLQQEIATSTLDLLELKKMICIKTQDMTRAAGAVVEMADGEDMVYRAASGTLEPFKGVRLNIRSSLSGQSVLKNEILYCEDSETDPRVDREACRKVGARSMICVPLAFKNKAVGVLKVVSPQAKAFSDRDVSLLKLITGLLSAAIALRKSESTALEATRTKSEFLAHMSHEIRTPMNGVIGMTSLLQDTRLDAQQREYVDTIQSSAHLLLTLINDLLDLSKIEAGKMTLEKVNFDLSHVVDEVRRLLSFSAENKKLNFSVDYSGDAPHFVQGDPTRIRQVLSNLANNAIKFTNSGSVKISITAQPSSQGSTYDYRFEITDTGIGLTKENLSQMFQPFSQADTSTTRRFGGTGLGLSICKNLVEMMGGQIGVSSEQGQGSTFWFCLSLPVGPSLKSSKPSADPAVQFSQKLNILIADDNRTNQLVAAQMIKKMGHQSKTVSNGKEVLEALKKEKFDLILMDCHMPELDGFQATQAIRASNQAWSQIPVIALTASAMNEDRDVCFQAGMTGYLSKPISLLDLAVAIESALPSRTKKSA